VNAIQLLSSQPWVERLGWTLVHFLWQGVLITALYAVARRWIAHSSRPNTRYVLACVTLAAMMAAPLVTWGLMRPSDAAPVLTHLTDRVPLAASTAALPLSMRAADSGVQAAHFLTWVVAVWLVGAIALSIRLIGGWVVAARIRSKLVRPAQPEWQQRLNRLKARVGVTRPVNLLISALVQAPAVVGWLRPVVLVPIGALAGLPSEQVEALLIHELAHIRRHDYLVNIVQSITEALLFYHPAVWWVSGHIRTERELCCDDIAVSLSGDAFTYALALVEIESSRPAHLHAAMAAHGGLLADRIARLLGQSRPVSRTLSGPAVIVSAILLMMAAYGMFGQSADSPRFEVASIKLETSAVPRHIVRPLPGGGLHTENASVRMLMQNAFALQSFQLAGGPGWIDSDGYDIDAKAAGSANQRQMWLMLQSLLEDRFKLKVHRETKELPVYALTAAKSGLKLPRPTEGGCASPTPDASTAAWAGGRMQPPGEGRTPQAPCGSVSVMLRPSGARMQGGKIPMPELIRMLSMVLGSTVIDKTGFTQLFDVRLDFLPDETTPALPPPPGPPDDSGASILIAMQEQLGLKLESTKGPVEVLVIDHVERPTEN
jgi:uncharacterized protein (TIGR03435 family)